MKNARQTKSLTSAVVPAQSNSTGSSKKGPIVKMSSLELVDFINEVRTNDSAALRHADFLAKVPLVLGLEYSEKFRSTYKATNGKRNPCYQFHKREACLMAMSYSYDMQALVYDRMTELEVTLHMRKTEYLPGHHQLHAALSGKAPDPQHQRFLHMNANKLLNKVAGIQSGQRGQAEHGSLAVLTVAQMLAQHAAAGAPDHKTAYSAIKTALQPLSTLCISEGGAHA